MGIAPWLARTVGIAYCAVAGRRAVVWDARSLSLVGVAGRVAGAMGIAGRIPWFMWVAAGRRARRRVARRLRPTGWMRVTGWVAGSMRVVAVRRTAWPRAGAGGWPAGGRMCVSGAFARAVGVACCAGAG